MYNKVSFKLNKYLQKAYESAITQEVQWNDKERKTKNWFPSELTASLQPS